MGKRILIVDDSAFARMMLKDVLIKNGYEVIGEAEDSPKAVTKYRHLKPDLVAMDICMPGTDGIETAKKIIKLDPSAKIVMVSTLGNRDQVMKAMQTGAKGFVVKPYAKDILLQAFDMALSWA